MKVSITSLEGDLLDDMIVVVPANTIGRAASKVRDAIEMEIPIELEEDLKPEDDPDVV